MYCENIISSDSTNLRKKSGAGADPHPFWTLWSLIYNLSSATFQLIVCIIWSDPFYDGSSFYVACVSNHCHQTNQNCRSMMGLSIHLYCGYNAFSSYRIYFSLMMSLTMISLMTSLTAMVLGPCYLVSALFCSLEILLVVPVEYFPLVVSVYY